MNSVKMTGRLVTTPKLAPTDKGRPVCDTRLLVDNGPYPSFEIAVSVFDEPAHACAGNLSRGDRVQVDGELRFRKWKDRAGRWHRGYSIVGGVGLLGGPSGRDAEKVVDRPDPGPAAIAA